MRLFGPGREIMSNEKKQSGIEENIGHTNYAMEDDSEEENENVEDLPNTGKDDVISLQDLKENKDSDNIENENRTGIKSFKYCII